MGSDVEDGQRSLNVIFSEDVVGRKLVSVTLEKNEIAVAGENHQAKQGQDGHIQRCWYPAQIPLPDTVCKVDGYGSKDREEDDAKSPALHTTTGKRSKCQETCY